MTEVEVRGMQGQEPRNVDSFWKLEKAKKRLSPGASRRSTALLTSDLLKLRKYIGVVLSLW